MAVKLDVMFTCWNRLRFTETAWACLMANTPWERVSTLRVYDDGSWDGAREFLNAVMSQAPVPVEFTHLGMKSPVAAQNHMAASTDADWYVKLDNDACVPPGWLEALLSVHEDEPALDLIGMEAGMTKVAGRDGEPWDGTYSYRECTHIGGIGLMRVEPFRRRRMTPQGRYGFQSWQNHPSIRRAWITPDLPLILLDRLPFEPWISLSAGYVAEGWQRPWPTWDPTWMRWAWEWAVGVVEGVAEFEDTLAVAADSMSA